VSERTRQQLGAASQRAGRHYMLSLTEWFRPRGKPDASLQTQQGRSDFHGVGPIGLEATISPWSRISGKLDQAADDAAARGLRWFAVVKRGERRRGREDDYAVLRLGVFWPLWTRLEELEAATSGGRAEYDRGFEAGFRFGKEQAS
jgi:hypothetical protein